MRLAPAARRRRGLNLTPMIDVVFLLLVFFMLVSRFGQLDGVPLALAGGAAPGWSGAPRLVDVRPEGLSLNGTALDEAALIADLRRLMPAPDAPVVLRPQDGADVQRLVAVIDLLRAAGITHVLMAE
ncbi:biopolymer transporter ExbD [Rhodobacter sp. HX-7-19]|uniref:Biopolymer transporter ExbD n=1 Tax=Paragemmobacter kunshanensis TaxID=2583234 RepID=A0A6M1U9N0_9RHOB|nr:biopolymer transporter ExbD [Rhodobacter kunshanensis]NGQ92133.1 biopolymer transporter ExbD [Rhodobacter kunshanensis]